MHMLYSASPPGDFLLLSCCANSLWFIAAEISFVNISIPCLDLLQILEIMIMFSLFKNTGPLHNSFRWFSLQQRDFPALRWGTWGKMGFSQPALSPVRTEPLFSQQSPSFLNRTPLFSAVALHSSKRPHCVELRSPSASSSFSAAVSSKASLICPVRNCY